MSHAYDGGIERKYIKLGGQRLLLAARGVTVPSTKITDLANLPTGWRDCGSLNNNSAEVTSKKELFTLMDGIPEMVGYQEIVGVTAQIKAVLNEWRFQNMWESMGQPPISHTAGSGSGTLESGSTRTVIKLGTGEGVQFAVDDVVVVDAAASCTTSANMAIVSAITGDDVTITPALAVAPPAGHLMKEINATLMGFGDTSIVELQAIVLFDAKDGVQIMHHIPKCAMLGEYNPSLAKTKENAVLPIQLEAYGEWDTVLSKTVLVRLLTFGKNAT